MYYIFIVMILLHSQFHYSFPPLLYLSMDTFSFHSFPFWLLIHAYSCAAWLLICLLMCLFICCYDFRWLGNHWQSKKKKKPKVRFGFRVQVSLEECKSNDLYCLKRFESGLSSKEDRLLKTSYRIVVSILSLYTVQLQCMSKQSKHIWVSIWVSRTAHE